MVESGKTHQEVEKILKDTNSAKKNEILFTDYQVNYNNIEAIYKKGTLIYYKIEKIDNV
jgi:tRNA(His) guanylyltransferase